MRETVLPCLMCPVLKPGLKQNTSNKPEDSKQKNGAVENNMWRHLFFSYRPHLMEYQFTEWLIDGFIATSPAPY